MTDLVFVLNTNVCILFNLFYFYFFSVSSANDKRNTITRMVINHLWVSTGVPNTNWLAVYIPKVNTPIKAIPWNIFFFIVLVILFLYGDSVWEIKKGRLKPESRSFDSCFKEIISIIPNWYTRDYPIPPCKCYKFTVIDFPVHFSVFYNDNKKLLGNQEYWILFSSIKTDDIVIVKFFSFRMSH